MSRAFLKKGKGVTMSNNQHRFTAQINTPVAYIDTDSSNVFQTTQVSIQFPMKTKRNIFINLPAMPEIDHTF